MNQLPDLWNAIDDGDEKTVRRLLDTSPDLLEATDRYGFTPLMHAAMCVGRTVPVIAAILRAGAEVNLRTSEGYTALHCAVGVDGEANENSAEVIALLVAAGADLKARQHYGWTPLLRAAVEGTIAEVEALLAAGADPNEVMPFDTLPAFNAGRTTLMAAAPDIAKVEALLRGGADPEVIDANGQNFFEYAGALQREYVGTPFAEELRRCFDMATAWICDDGPR